MKIIFAGTPDFAAVHLEALINTSEEIVAVYTQPDRPAGRGRKLTHSAVKNVALENNLPVRQPLNFKQDSDQQKLIDLNADIMIVVAYGLILPEVILQAPAQGCINVHASLLPRWRGAAPIHRAILAGDEKTGVAIMQMEKGLDTGAVYVSAECPISSDDTSGSLHDKLAVMGAKILVDNLSDIVAGKIEPTLQDDKLTNYATKLQKSEGEINWLLPASQINRLIHAFNPWPVAYTPFKGKILRFWNSRLISGTSTGNAGTVANISSDGLDINTGDGIIRIITIQKPGSKVMSVRDYLNSQTVNIGDKMGE